MSEAIALPTEPQPLPLVEYLLSDASVLLRNYSRKVNL